MTTLEFISLITMAAIYVFAGISHLREPKFFLKITPKWVPNPETVNMIVGIVEIVLGLAMLFNITRHYAAIGIIILLISVFPANIYNFKKARAKGKQKALTLIRLPIQALLIYWAYCFT